MNMIAKTGFRMAAVGLALAAAAQAQVNNALTPAEKDAGYSLLFNGTDLSNWKTYQSTTPPSSWVVQQDGDAKAIVVTAGGVGHLISKQNDLQNFDLKIEWKVPTKGNSGIFIRYMEIDAWGGASGPEAQVVDINHSDGQQALHRAGTCYDLFPLIQGRDNWWKPTGEWNQFRIVAFNNRVAHYGNGKKLIEYDFSSKAFNDAYLASKYRTYPNYKTIHPGAIYLQHHGETGIKYRNMRVKKLTQDPWAAGSIYLKADGGLIDDFTFADNLFPAPTTMAPLAPAGGEGLRFTRGSRGMSLLFPGPGEYIVRLSDLQGRTRAVQAVRGESWTLPAGDGAVRVLSVTSGSQTLHHGILPAP
jgi:hypothetical protein